MRTLLAYSGGLDTSYLVAKLSAEGHDVIAATVDCGGFDAAERAAIAARATALGASEHRFVDGRRVRELKLFGRLRVQGAAPLPSIEHTLPEPEQPIGWPLRGPDHLDREVEVHPGVVPLPGHPLLGGREPTPSAGLPDQISPRRPDSGVVLIKINGSIAVRRLGARLFCCWCCLI